MIAERAPLGAVSQVVLQLPKMPMIAWLLLSLGII
jgi:hypothetical protein